MLTGAETVPKIDELRVVTVVVKLDSARFCDHYKIPHTRVGNLNPEEWDVPPKPNGCGGTPTTGTWHGMTAMKRFSTTAALHWSRNGLANNLQQNQRNDQC